MQSVDLKIFAICDIFATFVVKILFGVDLKLNISKKQERNAIHLERMGITHEKEEKKILQNQRKNTYICIPI